MIWIALMVAGITYILIYISYGRTIHASMKSDGLLTKNSHKISHHKIAGHWSPIFMTILIGIPTSMFLAGYILYLESRQEELFYKQRAMQMQSVVEQRLQSLLGALGSISTLFDAVDYVTGAEFKQFVTPIFVRQPEIDSMVWVPFVRVDRKAAFESDAQVTYREFKMRKLDGSELNEKPEGYFPIYYQQPDSGKETGLDLGTDPTIAKSSTTRSRQDRYRWLRDFRA